MNEVRKSIIIGGPLNWPWIWVGFCLLVTFHMIPTALIIRFLEDWRPLSVILPLWIFCGLSLNGMYIGYRSLGVTIIEPLISSLLYIIILALLMNAEFSVFYHKKDLLVMLIWMIPGLFCAFFGAWLGELSQHKKEQKQTQTTK